MQSKNHRGVSAYKDGVHCGISVCCPVSFHAYMCELARSETLEVGSGGGRQAGDGTSWVSLSRTCLKLPVVKMKEGML